MEAVLAFLASPAGGAALSFLMSEASTGVTWIQGLTSGTVTVDDAMAAWAKASAVFNAGDKAVDDAEKASPI